MAQPIDLMSEYFLHFMVEKCIIVYQMGFKYIKIRYIKVFYFFAFIMCANDYCKFKRTVGVYAYKIQEYYASFQ